MIETLAYNLPDIQLLEKEANQYSIWIPDKVYIVLGASNNAVAALFTENVTADRVLVLRRPNRWTSSGSEPTDHCFSRHRDRRKQPETQRAFQ